MDLPIKGVAFSFKIGLEDQANPGKLKANPTLATGDATISKDGGSLANLGTLPTVTPASGKVVKVSLSATEMAADDIVVVLSDASGSEWFDTIINIKPIPFLGSTVDDSTITPTTTTFGSDLGEATDDHFDNMFVHFLTGALAGQSAKIQSYDAAGGQITVASAMTEAPSDGDKFIITGRSE